MFSVQLATPFMVNGILLQWKFRLHNTNDKNKIKDGSFDT